MELLTETVKLVTAVVLLVVALLKLRSMSHADGPDSRKKEEGRDDQ